MDALYQHGHAFHGGLGRDAVSQIEHVARPRAVAGQHLFRFPTHRIGLTEQRGQWFATPTVPHVLATLHPAYVLIQPPETLAATRAILAADLAQVAARYRELRSQAPPEL